MLSILLKRQAQAKKKQNDDRAKQPLSAVIAPQLEQKSHTRSTLMSTPWVVSQNALKQDLAYLRTLAGSQEKAPFKTELVNKYHPLVTQLLSTHKQLTGLDIIWWFYQWQIDLGMLEQVHDDFRAAINKGLETPFGWSSNGQTAYCDIVFKYAHTADKEKAECKREYLINAVQDLLEGNLATNAPLKVKMFRLVGDWYHENGELEKAHKMFDLVMKLDPKKGGRKTKLKELEEDLENGNPHEEPGTNENSTVSGTD